jgi:hypothetical protein
MIFAIMNQYSLRKLEKDIRQLHEQKMYVPAIIMILLGIELMGSYLDNEPFDKAGLSEKRFNKALKKLFPKEVYAERDFLYRTLRAELIHGLNSKNFNFEKYERLIQAYFAAHISLIEENLKFKIIPFKLKNIDN